LIEAVNRFQLTVKFSNFRGPCASASLKQLKSEARPKRAGTFPRPMRLGLIEADSIVKRNFFPATFPRPMRLGLIEAARYDACKSVFSGGFPRPMRLGLIEARNAGFGRSRPSRISEAHAPRPH